ncbi:hypothetical protein B0T20DRAFT_481532 [Sordaria brevicollis]|uniref:Uncharacterized protein n=1 Tax=Sordaria brevicollis TaxID=83679 RepID=A0AAE0UAL8_SORBR|nr:hypothetical protein B0T20DRAFT_481532 [Sordaria brevicollis]
MASRKSPLSLFSAALLACASLTQHAHAAPYPQPEPQPQQGVQWVTSIWTDTLTQTHTSVYTIAAAVATGGPDCVPNLSLGESACGNICCAADQKCQYAGQCMERGPNDGAPYLGSTAGGHTYTTQYSAPYRPTSGATGTAASATASSSSGAGAGGAAGGGGTADTGLSGGAIAGIVIGTLAGVVLLLLLCACCIVRGLWHGFLAIFGIGAGKRRDRETVVEEERYARHSGSSGWYAGAGGRPSGAGARKESHSSGKGLMGAGAALGTLWLLLGMKKDKDKKKETRRKSRSENSSYYYSDYTSSGSPSSFSSDRRTRRSARSASAHGAGGGGPGRTRTASRVTRTTTRVSRVSSVPPPPPGQRRMSRSPGPMRG